MSSLDSSLRNMLETVIVKARDVSEEASSAALKRLALDQPEPFPTMTPEQRKLRVWLRAKARQMGDLLDKADGEKSIMYHIIAECAYEHWHQMLFARFLAENNLLMHPSGVPITLVECEELASSEGASDGWVLAARYASKMLPGIFRPEDPLLEVEFSLEHKKALENLMTELPANIFTADDSLGWTYQFWQSKRKDEVNESEEKITGDFIAPVTQLFTEDYIVQFLIHNSIGAWWITRHSKETLPIKLEFLRLIDDTTPAAGKFLGWPNRAKDIKILDPCCGSGHFLIVAFDLIVKFRILEENLSNIEATDAVLRDNIYALEIDPRCTQIAAFNLALKAWKFSGYHNLPKLNIACSGLSVGKKEDEWLELANDDESLKVQIGRLYQQFRDAPDLGSLININMESNIKKELFHTDYSKIKPILDKILKSENNKYNIKTIGVSALGVAEAAEILSGQYTLVITNVPYLKRGKQGHILYNFCNLYYPEAKGNIATVFMERCLELCAKGGTCALVTPQNWRFQDSYKEFRLKLLREYEWGLLSILGSHAFQTITGEVVDILLIIITNSYNSNEHIFAATDLSFSNSIQDKIRTLMTGPIKNINQKELLNNPDARISLEKIERLNLLSNYAEVSMGLQTGDKPRFVRYFWEFGTIPSDWRKFQSTVTKNTLYGGREQLFQWSNGHGPMQDAPGYVLRKVGWGKKGVLVSLMGKALNVTLYTGDAHDNNTAVIIPKNNVHLSAIWLFCNSNEFNKSLNEIGRSLKVTSNILEKLPFDLEYWLQISRDQEPLPQPFSNDPKQWLFNGNILSSINPLHVAVPLLLGYKWPGQEDSNFSINNSIIACIPACSGEQSAAERLRLLLAKAYGDSWSNAKQDELLSQVGYAGKSLDDWLRNGFFEQHCKLFLNSPFIWHIWDGRRDGFSVLVNYHKLDRHLLETLTYTYLGDWISLQEEAVKNSEGGAEARLLAAKDLQNKLKLILDGESPYDIYVRWKKPYEQPIGWEPDLNDGVRLNIRPLVVVNILRSKFNINWTTDRGRDSDGSERINDRHLTIVEKKSARKERENR